MNFLSLIEGKRDGTELSPSDIGSFVQAFTAGEIPDYQTSAFLMAVFFRGLSASETASLTLAMRDSGDLLSLPRDSRPVVDKHSTGGVGDKVSLPLAPLLACLEFRVPMISGRGLGITGGTLDKLDSIPGFQTLLPASRIIEIAQQTGCVICGQTDRMVPADKGLYALRDVTGTVPSRSLIVASILSKKLAENLDSLLLDVKFGSAAFMQTIEEARRLADGMVSLGNQCGVKTRAILTNMNRPLGAACGNWLEVKESVQCLDGKGPGDLRELVLECAAQLLLLEGRHPSIQEARAAAENCLNSQAPREKWNEMIAAQGADMAAFEHKLGQDHTAPIVIEVLAEADGFVTGCNARVLGEVVRDLGGGRLTKESVINHEVGLDAIAPAGASVKSGDLLVRAHARSSAEADNAKHRLRAAFNISPEPEAPAPLITETVC